MFFCHSISIKWCLSSGSFRDSFLYVLVSPIRSRIVHVIFKPSAITNSKLKHKIFKIYLPSCQKACGPLLRHHYEWTKLNPKISIARRNLEIWNVVYIVTTAHILCWSVNNSYVISLTGNYPRCFVLQWLQHVRPVENVSRERKLKESCKAEKLVNIEDLPSSVSPQLSNCVHHKIAILKMMPTSISRPTLDRPTAFIDDLPAPWNPEECSEKIAFSCITFFWIQKKRLLGDTSKVLQCGRLSWALFPRFHSNRTRIENRALLGY